MVIVHTTLVNGEVVDTSIVPLDDVTPLIKTETINDMVGRIVL